MASKNRSTTRAVTVFAALARDCHSFDFFEAVRRIECAHSDQPRIGTSSRPIDDPVRLTQDPSLTFAPATLSSFTSGASGRPPRLAGAFFGLLGPNGPLPSHLTEYADERRRHAHDVTFVRFLDVFHHRMLSLFYRAWSSSRPSVSFDRVKDDWFARYLSSLIGFGTEGLASRDRMPDRARLHYAGFLACQTRNPDGLAAMLADFFGLAVGVKEFIGEWVSLPKDARCRLGASKDTGTLGLNVVAGSCIWSGQHKFRVVVGAVGFTDYQRFLPGEGSLGRLVAFVRTYAGDALDWDINIVLRRDEVPILKADARGRLGWTTWLAAERIDRDPDDLVFTPRLGSAMAA